MDARQAEEYRREHFIRDVMRLQAAGRELTDDEIALTEDVDETDGTVEAAHQLETEGELVVDRDGGAWSYERGPSWQDPTARLAEYKEFKER